MTRIFHDVAAAEHRVYISGQDLKAIKALAEQDIIAEKGASLGKNAEERDRNLTIGLMGHKGYQIALQYHRALEEAAAMLKADLDLYKDARRQEEWSIRAALVDALNRRNLPSDPIDQGFDEGVTDDIDNLIYEADRMMDADDGLPF